MSNRAIRYITLAVAIVLAIVLNTHYRIDGWRMVVVGTLCGAASAFVDRLIIGHWKHEDENRS